MTRYGTPAAFRQALEQRLANSARDRGTSLDRLRRRLVFERILVRLELDAPGFWVLKGGMALELRWREAARTTRDLDLVTRLPNLEPGDGEPLRRLVIRALEADLEQDGFRFVVGTPQPLATDDAGRPGWRLPVRGDLAGRQFASVSVDIVARADEIAGTERITLTNGLSFAAFPSHDFETIDPAQHFAEKLHALTRDYGRENSRVRDLVDIVMLHEQGLLEGHDLMAAARHVFDLRGTHELPDELPDPPDFWRGRYDQLVADLEVDARTVDEAMRVAQQIWTTARAAEEGR